MNLTILCSQGWRATAGIDYSTPARNDTSHVVAVFLEPSARREIQGRVLYINTNAKKRHHSEIRIAINDESQGSIAKNLRCDKLLYYTFIIHSAGERIFKIGEHLAKLQVKSLTVSYTQLTLHFCPQRCRSRQISWITCVLQTETVIKRCYVNRQINVS